MKKEGEKGQLTRNQLLVHGVLQKARRPLSAYAILDRLRARGIKAPLQVYRALDVLMARGLAHRLESLNAFIACCAQDCHLPAVPERDGSRERAAIGFAICEKCGCAEEFLDVRLNRRLQTCARERGFLPAHSVVEISGLCARCARDARS